MKNLFHLVLCLLLTSAAFSQSVTCGSVLNETHCYDDIDATTWLFTASDGSSVLRISFNAGEIEDCCDFITIYDGVDDTAPILYNGNNGGDLAGVEVTATGPNIFMEIDSDGSVSCIDDDGIPYVLWDWDVACLNCTPATGEATLGACTTGYMIDVNVLSVGDGTVVISNDGGVGATTVMMTGITPIGPFPFGSTVTVTLEHPTDPTCNTILPALAISPSCPPTNDDCSAATTIACDDTLVGETTSGSSENGDDTGCDMGAGVWYEFEGIDGTITLSVQAGAGFDHEIAVASSTDCVSFANVDCADIGFDGGLEEITFVASLGTTYYFYVGHYDFSTTFGTFDISVTCTSCIEPTFSLINGTNDCPVGTDFNIDVIIPDLGSASTVDVTYDEGSGPVTVSGVSADITIGPFAAGTTVEVSVADSADGTCNATASITTPIACPPDEDNCLGAKVIPVTPDLCTGITTGNNAGATDSNNDVPPPPAATCTAYLGGDIWFSLEVPASGNVTISGASSPDCCSFLWYEVYSGTDCSTLTSIMCSSTTGNDPSLFEMVLNGQTPGATLWIRAWDSNNDNGPGEFNFCAKEVAPLANDECDSPEIIIESSDINCNNAEPSTTLTATTSAVNDCSFSPDVWFELEAVSASITVTASNLMPAGPSGLIPVNTVLMVYESCSSANIACGFSPVTFTATPGSTYLIAASTRDADNFTAPATFDICAYPTPSPPGNDECESPEVIEESTNETCNNAEPSTTLSATISANNDCSFSPDVWFELEAVSASITVTASNLMPAGPSGLVPASTVLMVYETCSSASVACGFSPITFTATPGTTYLIAASTRDINNFTAPATFDICAYPTPQPPVNDVCANAIMVSQSVSTACENKVSGTTYFSTFSSENICAGGGNDVWYSFVATAETMGVLVDNLQPTAAGGIPANAVVGVFSGACGTFTQLACVFDQTEIPVTLGETYYVSVTCRDAGNFPVFSDFDVCVYALPPPNDECTTATVLAVNTTLELTDQYFGGATASGIGTEICDVTAVPTPRDVWYSVTMPANGGDLTVIVEPGPNSDVVVAVYDECGSPIPEQCVDLGGNGGVETINFNANGNEDYFVRVYEKIASGAFFEIEIILPGYCSSGDNMFIGTDGNWDLSANWSEGCIPASPYVGTLTIMENVNSSSLGAFALTGDLIVEDGATFDHNNGNNFTVDGDIVVKDGGNISNTSTVFITD